MENLTLFDTLSLVIIFVSALLAFFRGLSRELLSIASWIIAFILAFFWAPSINPLLDHIPVVNEILADSCQLSILIAFVIGFILSLIIISLFVPIISNFVQKSLLNNIDRTLGLAFGILRGGIIVVMILVVHDFIFLEGQGMATVEKARTTEIFEPIKEKLKIEIQTSIPDWIKIRFDILTSTCSETTKNKSLYNFKFAVTAQNQVNL